MKRSAKAVFLANLLATFVISIPSLVAGQSVSQSPRAQATAYLERYSHPAAGVSFAVAVNGQLVFSAGWGFADLDNLVRAQGSTVYNIGSLSKINTAIAVMQLVERKQISLDDSAQKYVPSFPNKAVTIYMLMTQTSGIRHYRLTDFGGLDDDVKPENVKPFGTFEEAIKIFKDDPLLFKPGEYYFYSSYAVNLLQGVIEAASGLPFEEYMKRYVWLPAGMLSTAFDLRERLVPNRARGYRVTQGQIINEPYGDVSYKFASGGMISTVDDLVRLGTALNHGLLLKPNTIAEMYKVQLSPILQYQENGSPKESLEFQQALMWRINKDAAGRRFVYHCGSVKGSGACLVNYPDQDVVLASAENSLEGGPGWHALVDVAQFFLPPSN